MLEGSSPGLVDLLILTIVGANLKEARSCSPVEVEGGQMIVTISVYMNTHAHVCALMLYMGVCVQRHTSPYILHTTGVHVFIKEQ